MESMICDKMVALIPLRGGSKGIPNKNVKLMNEYPLFVHVLLSAVACKYIDKIYISTDIQNVGDIVHQYISLLPYELYHKVKVIERSEESCTDDASTEKLMLEFAEKYLFENIILLQATSPFTKTSDLCNGIMKFYKETFTSLLSVVVNKRFYWKTVNDKTGEISAINYDIYNRKRRQEMDGCLLENGAFYITRKDALMKTKSRLSGKIGSYVMDDYTGIEVDAMSDWIMTEALLKSFTIYSNKIKLLIVDCDGVMTDGCISVSNEKVFYKTFSVIDGMGISLLKNYGIKIGVLSSEKEDIIKWRGEKLRVDIMRFGVKNKEEVLEEICKENNVSMDNVAYIGDDINDFCVIKRVGISFAPKNAQDIIKRMASVKLECRGGLGAIREAINFMILNKLI